jgi:hypothetical protein
VQFATQPADAWLALSGSQFVAACAGVAATLANCTSMQAVFNTCSQFAEHAGGEFPLLLLLLLPFGSVVALN